MTKNLQPQVWSNGRGGDVETGRNETKMVIWLKLPAQPSAEKWILKTSLSNLDGSWFLVFVFFRTNNSEFENAALEEDMQSPSEGSRVMC